MRAFLVQGERRDSNPRPPGPQPGALPTELRPPRLRPTHAGRRWNVAAASSGIARLAQRMAGSGTSTGTDGAGCSATASTSSPGSSPSSRAQTTRNDAGADVGVRAGSAGRGSCPSRGARPRTGSSRPPPPATRSCCCAGRSPSRSTSRFLASRGAHRAAALPEQLRVGARSCARAPRARRPPAPSRAGRARA